MSGNERLERLVWAAAFAAAFENARVFAERHGLDRTSLSGFTAAEYADMAVEQLREALTCGDAQYLLPVKEAWEVA